MSRSGAELGIRRIVLAIKLGVDAVLQGTVLAKALISFFTEIDWDMKLTALSPKI